MLTKEILLHQTARIYIQYSTTEKMNTNDDMIQNSEEMFTRFDTIHERDRQTDGQTDRQTTNNGIGRAYAWHRTAKVK